MADIAIYLCLENLKQLLSSGLASVASQKDQLQSLQEHINQMSMLLKSMEEEGSTGRKDNSMAMEIKDVVSEAENIIDLFTFGSVADAAGGGGDDLDLSAKLDSAKEEMVAIVKKYKDGTNELELRDSKEDTTTRVVGLRPKVDEIIHRFKHGNPLEIISIVGLPGIGKTTLAKEIYNDDRTQEKFEIRAWIKVSQDYRKRNLLAGILESLNPIFKEKWDTDVAADEESLTGQLLEQLQDHKYLIVIDDMWSAQALLDIRTSLPDQCNGSKIIVTTQEAMVAKAIKEQDYYDSYASRLDPMSEEDSWELFQRKMLQYHETVMSKELKEFGKMMVKQCHGLPLAIAVICEVLARKATTPSLWGSTANRLATFLKGYIEENLICRYDELPPHLKACLLYIGSFPEHYLIPVRDLVWLLVAEGIVTEAASDGQNGIAPIIPEVIAEAHISELVDRCLVMVSAKSICGATKTCRVFSLLREFCSVRGEEGKFAYQVLHSDQTCALSVTQNDCRRLFISRKAYTKISLEPCAQSLRSILCFRIGDDGYWMHPNWVFHEYDFKLLKVLNLLSIPSDFPSDIGAMVHLTFLAVRCKVLPESIANLFNLETLILFSKSIYLPYGILSMVKLKHVCNKDGVLCFAQSGIVGNLGVVESLQTVYPLCSCVRCRMILTKCPRIRKLGLSDDRPGYFNYARDDIALLEHLETLKCNFPNYGGCDAYYRWLYRTQKLKLPSSIKRLTLSSTFLKWENISTLGTLPSLEVLKLLDNACVMRGDVKSCWDTSEQEFPRLKCLKMRNLDISKWVDNNVQFKSLEVLLIEGCGRLVTLPSGLARVPRLHTLQVIRCYSLKVMSKSYSSEE